MKFGAYTVKDRQNFKALLKSAANEGIESVAELLAIVEAICKPKEREVYTDLPENLPDSVACPSCGSEVYYAETRISFDDYIRLCKKCQYSELID